MHVSGREGGETLERMPYAGIRQPVTRDGGGRCPPLLQHPSA